MIKIINAKIVANDDESLDELVSVTEERMGETYGEASEGRSSRKNQATSNRAPSGGGAPRLPKQPKIEQITEEKDTSQPGNAAANIAAAYTPKPPKAVTEAEVKSEIVAVCLRGQPTPSPIKPLVIPAPAILPPTVIPEALIPALARINPLNVAPTPIIAPVMDPLIFMVVVVFLKIFI